MLASEVDATFHPPKESARYRARALAGLASATLVGSSLIGAVLASGTGAETGARERSEAARTAEPTHAAAVRYGRDVRPLLADRCFACHGPDPAKRQAELRLDEFASATAEREGGAAIVPGKSAASELVRRISSDDPDVAMPPAAAHKARLSPEEARLVARWIDEGARFEPHWAFVPPTRPVVPEPIVPDSGAAGTSNEIDAFVRQGLREHGLEASPPADRATQLRRVFLDLTGLPPTPEERAEFLADARPDAWERQVERLLHEEPWVSRYAERMAQPWLDAARYADTCGIHTDAGRQIWPWRDWVLRALRDGMPFDRFLTEQLAGDLLPDATLDQKVASGFNRNHVTTDEGGAIAEEYLVEYAVDRTNTVGSVFLGLTMGCARCHDHKYDPLTQQDYYSLYAFFNSIEEPGLYSQLPDSKRAFEPFLRVPRPEQDARLSELAAALASERAAIESVAPGEVEEARAFEAEVWAEGGVRWPAARVLAARSRDGATMSILDDGSVLAQGANPDRDEHTFEIEIEGDGRDLRLIALEALADESLFEARVGRAPNGNAVLSAVRVEAFDARDASVHRDVPLAWAWADFEQENGDFRVVNALAGPDRDGSLGWAVGAHNRPGGRAALFLADAPFGYEAGTRLVVSLSYDSIYPQHVLGRVRLSAGALSEAGLARLPCAVSGWYATAPFAAENGQAAYETAFGPESAGALETGREFGPGRLRFNFVEAFRDGRLNSELAGGINASYVARRVFAPTARTLEVSLGSDDGFRLFLDGEQVAANQVDRSLAADQDRVSFAVPAGTHTLVLKIVNSGGLAGFYWRFLPSPAELWDELAATLLPARARFEDLEARRRSAWRLAFSPSVRAHTEAAAALEAERTALEAEVPLTMVMREQAQPRPTNVLTRGQYDHPDAARPVARATPAALGPWPAAAPLDRLGLARWMLAPTNPLVARVAVNRLWETLFGFGLVRTSEDFGMQGEWPSHPELLDWLAVEYRESGWDTKALVAKIVTSATYRQSARATGDLAQADPDNRWLARYPRRRLTAEQVRDQALYAAGLLVERFGGPSVKPYQPEGLWQEVAMPASNTRIYERGEGDELWRRSLYTYWKRASPPPAMLTFDAPTREFCTIRRIGTNTPLQALVLWNDEQFVEAARVLAERTLLETPAPAGDGARLSRLFERCAARPPEPAEEQLLADALRDLRARFAEHEADARALIAVGARAAAEALDARELAAWTLVASAVLDSDAALTQD